jgi:dihydrofolate reductase
MEKIKITALAAIGKNRELGKGGDLLWKLDADFVRMRKLIAGHTLIMGRKTYESVGRELNTCLSVVVTSDKNYVSPYENTKYTTIVHSLKDAFVKAKKLELRNENTEKEVIIFGGAQIYKDALPQTDRLYLTEIDASDATADTYFPEYPEFTKVLEEKDYEEDGIHYRIRTLERQ